MTPFVILYGLFVVLSHSISVPSTTDNPEYQQCWNFLVENMPERDVENELSQVLNETITYSLLTRNMDLYSGYTKNLPFDIFQNYVLPYATLSEGRDNWRKYFYDTLYPLVINNATMNQNSVSNITLWFVNAQNKLFNLYFDPDSTPLVYSPFEVLTYGYGSCTGYSLFVIAALRSMGIAARIAGTPQWVYDILPMFDLKHQNILMVPLGHMATYK